MHSVPFELPAVDALHRPDLRAAILSMPVARTLGLRVVGFTSGVSVMELDVRPEVTFDGCTVQGGIVGTLADVAGVSAATAALPAGGPGSTRGFEVHHLAPARVNGYWRRDGRSSWDSHTRSQGLRCIP